MRLERSRRIVVQLTVAMFRGRIKIGLGSCVAAAALMLALREPVVAGEPAVLFDVQPRVLAVGETALATIMLRNLDGADAPSPPSTDAFRVEPAGVEHRLQMSGGAADRWVVHKFALTALKAGEHTIGPLRVAAGGRVWELPAVRLSVAPAAAGAGAGVEARAMARLRLNKSSVYVHEPFTIEIDLLSHGVELDRQVELQNMPTAGLKIGPFAELPLRREIVEGEVFDVRTFRAEARALNSGELPLQPVLSAQAIVRRGRRSSDPLFGPFEDFFVGTPFERVERRPVVLPAAPVTLTVRPLPLEGRPESFSGAVGACTWDVEVRPMEVNAGEPVTITMTIRGDANLDTVRAPTVRLGPEFRVYEPRLVSRPGRDERERVFEQIVIPRDETAREIPALAFAYFDPIEGKYRELVRGPFPLVVRPQTNGAAALRVSVPVGGATGPQVVSEGTEIAYLKSVPVRPRRGLQPSPVGVALNVVAPPLLAAAVLGWVRRRERIASDPALARRARAPRAARAAVRRMREAVGGNAREFYDAMWSALTSYFGDRLNLPPGDVDAERVLAAFGPAIEEPVRRAIAELFAQCASARFGGGEAPASVRREQLDRLLGVLARCERVRR
ncbi:MAG: BatD family protein [Kiritimatiellae bacterium]|nr:BatD family protein [Kiritimatiellia bacterium]